MEAIGIIVLFYLAMSAYQSHLQGMKKLIREELENKESKERKKELKPVLAEEPTIKLTPEMVYWRTHWRTLRTLRKNGATREQLVYMSKNQVEFSFGSQHPSKAEYLLLITAVAEMMAKEVGGRAIFEPSTLPSHS
jgi:hypothetical protein